MITANVCIATALNSGRYKYFPVVQLVGIYRSVPLRIPSGLEKKERDTVARSIVFSKLPRDRDSFMTLLPGAKEKYCSLLEQKGYQFKAISAANPRNGLYVTRSADDAVITYYHRRVGH